MRVPFSIKPRTSNLKFPVTSRYRHDALLCVHQVGLAPLHLSSIQATPEPGRFAFPAPAGCRRSIGLVAVDLAIAAADPFCLADLAAVVADSAAADPVDPAVAADPASGLAVAVSVDSVATVSAAADLDFFAVSVCPFAAATEKGRAAVAISCFLAPRFSF